MNCLFILLLLLCIEMLAYLPIGFYPSCFFLTRIQAVIQYDFITCSKVNMYVPFPLDFREYGCVNIGTMLLHAKLLLLSMECKWYGGFDAVDSKWLYLPVTCVPFLLWRTCF